MGQLACVGEQSCLTHKCNHYTLSRFVIPLYKNTQPKIPSNLHSDTAILHWCFGNDADGVWCSSTSMDFSEWSLWSSESHGLESAVKTLNSVKHLYCKPSSLPFYRAGFFCPDGGAYTVCHMVGPAFRVWYFDSLLYILLQKQTSKQKNVNVKLKELNHVHPLPTT